MKGLLLKDLLILKNQMRNVLMVIIGFVIISIRVCKEFCVNKNSL